MAVRTEWHATVPRELRELHDAQMPELAARTRARDLCHALNAARDAPLATRQAITNALFAAGGDSVLVQPPFFCDFGSHTTLGERVFMNFNCIIVDVCPVSIGAGTLIGPGVQIVSRDPDRPVSIGADVWIGCAAIIGSGVTIGDGAVIGAGSVVTSDVPSRAFAAGNPCRIIRTGI